MTYGRSTYGRGMYASFALASGVIALSGTSTATATTVASLDQGLTLSATSSAVATSTATILLGVVLEGEVEFTYTQNAGLAIIVPPVEPPTLSGPYTIQRVSPIMPVPDLDEQGRPI